MNFTKDGARIAGCMRNDGRSGAPDTWSVYLASDDATATVDAAVAHGGQVIAPAMDVADLGTMAIVTDAGGAAVGMWQPGSHTGFGLLGEPGSPGWFELHTRDHDAAVVFYFAVDDTDAAVATVQRLGGRVVQPAEDSPYGRLAEVADPTGALFKLVSRS